MGSFRFRRSIKLLPGVRVNLGKKGASLSLGGRGLTHTIGRKNSRTTVGIPGTGLSYTEVHQHERSQNSQPAKASGGAKLLFFIIAAFVFFVWLFGKLM